MSRRSGALFEKFKHAVFIDFVANRPVVIPARNIDRPRRSEQGSKPMRIARDIVLGSDRDQDGER